jgi:hypothetical protein
VLSFQRLRERGKYHNQFVLNFWAQIWTVPWVIISVNQPFDTNVVVHWLQQLLHILKRQIDICLPSTAPQGILPSLFQISISKNGMQSASATSATFVSFPRAPDTSTAFLPLLVMGCHELLPQLPAPPTTVKMHQTEWSTAWRWRGSRGDDKRWSSFASFSLY